MIRYINSFILTSILYSIVIGVFFYAYSNQQLVIEKKIEKKKVSLKHIELVTKEAPKIKKPIKKVVKEVKPKVIKKKIKKIVEKRVIKKKKKVAKLKPKKIIEKKIVKKEEPKVRKKIIEKKVDKLVKKEEVLPLSQKIVKNSIPTKTVIKNYQKDFLKKNLLLIKKYIQNHVKYSKRARKMNIQGDVLVEFSLSKSGEITNIKALSGHRLLRKSTIKAIHKASSYFPKVSKNITIKVPISYKLI